MRVLIVGSRGQDGTLLTDLLSRGGDQVVGLHTDGVDSRIVPVPKTDLLSPGSAEELFKNVSFNQVYYLAALPVASQDRQVDEPDFLRRSWEVNVEAYHNVLESLRKHSPDTRVFYACTCHIFAETRHAPQSETSHFAPNSIYGITKLSGHLLSRMYRKKHGLFCTSGILYNHESHLRSAKFLSKKVVQGAIAIKNEGIQRLELGNLQNVVDWGHAMDYVEAMRLSLSLEEPGEFIIASGVGRSVQDFVEAVFAELGLDWRKYVSVEASLTKGGDRGPLIGDPRRIEAAGWKRKFSFDAMIKDLISRST